MTSKITDNQYGRLS